ncbi:MAG TPA: hypothetical protein VGM98_13040 [Schlesneria sp.]
MLRFCRLAGLCLAVSCNLALAQVRPELKYPPNTKSVSETSVKTSQTLTLAGMDLETKSTTFSLTSKSIGQRAADGTLPIEEKVQVLQTELDLPGGNKIQFDSANPDKKADNPLFEPLMERLRVTFKTPVTVILDDVNKIKEVKFPDGSVESLDESNKSLFNSAKRKTAAEQARGYLPDELVKIGDSWERNLDLDLGGGQTFAFRIKYTYAGTVEQDGGTFDKITAKVVDISYTIDAANSPVQVTKSTLKVEESNEVILFDRNLGAVQQKTAKTRIAGPITLVVNGTELEGKVDLTLEETTKRQK